MEAADLCSLSVLGPLVCEKKVVSPFLVVSCHTPFLVLHVGSVREPAFLLQCLYLNFRDKSFHWIWTTTVTPAGQSALGCSSPFSHRTGITGTWLLHLAFYLGAGDLRSGLHAV